MITTITRRYHFESAHFLPKVPDGHKCKRLHGHNYQMDVTVSGPLDEVGFLVDFWDLDRYVSPLVTHVDHRLLNEMEELENPTAEYIAAWFLKRLQRIDSTGNWQVTGVRIYETPECWADVHI
jgi:6-pyruvoyltetrahydropterin/6-carboxytetrahydropterin synthase